MKVSVRFLLAVALAAACLLPLAAAPEQARVLLVVVVEVVLVVVLVEVVDVSAGDGFDEEHGGHGQRDALMRLVLMEELCRAGSGGVVAALFSNYIGLPPIQRFGSDEMKARVGTLVGSVARKMWVSTFHSACVRILRRDADAIGFPSSFTIYDQADAVRLTGYVLRDLNLDTKKMPPRSVHAQISAAKNDYVLVDEYADRAGSFTERKLADVYREYQARLLRAGAMGTVGLAAGSAPRQRELGIDERAGLAVLERLAAVRLLQGHDRVCAQQPGQGETGGRAAAGRGVRAAVPRVRAMPAG